MMYRKARKSGYCEVEVFNNQALPQMNTGMDNVDALTQQIIVYAKVTQGNNPVVGAKVR